MKKAKMDPKKKRKLCILGVVVVIVFVVVLFYFFQKESEFGIPVLTIETPKKLSCEKTDTFILDVMISHFGEAVYPAASMSISFDASRLEFVGVEEGNVCIHYAGPNQNMQQQLPEWSYNVEQSNKSGLINIMYLDTTGGKNAFSKELLAEDENIVLRLKFRLRGSARAGDIYDLVIEDAVFAASDETQSLAMLQNTLKVKNSKIVIGE